MYKILTHEGGQYMTFFEILQTCKELDLRDNRGKRHCLAFVLLGLLVSLLRKRDGKLSSIHRSMVNKHKELCDYLAIEECEVISRSHLPILLGKVNLPVFEALLSTHYGILLNKEEQSWFAGDGKDLRGSIESGNKRGEALVQVVRHKDRAIVCQDNYSGKKESEKVCLRSLLNQADLENQNITMDALHLSPLTTEPIEKSGGVFVVGLKDNQKELAEDMAHSTNYLPIAKQARTVEKGHGRIEIRNYFQYDISGEYFDSRWKDSNFQTLIKVERTRIITKTNKESKQTAYYISNGNPQQEEYFQAIREHWSVEVVNHVRDVTLQEDKLKTKKKPVTMMMAGLRTVVIKLLNFEKPKNMIAQLELFQDDFQALMNSLKAFRFL